MEGYPNYENPYGNGDYEVVYEDAYAYQNCEVVYHDAYAYPIDTNALEDAYTDYGGVYNSTDAYGDADSEEAYYDAQDSVEGTAISGNLCDSQVAQSSESQQQSSSLDTLQASLIAYAVLELREGVRQTFSTLVPRVTAVCPSVVSKYSHSAYLTQPCVSKASEARLSASNTSVEGSVNAESSAVAMQLSGLQGSREAVGQSDIFEECSNQSTDTNTQSCSNPHESVQPTPSIYAYRAYKRTRSHSWSGFSYKAMVSTHTQTESEQVDRHMDDESGFDDTNNSFGQDNSFDSPSPVEPTTSHVRSYAEVVRAAIDSRERVTSKNSLALG